MAHTPNPRPSISQRPRISLGETDTFLDEISSTRSSNRPNTPDEYLSKEHPSHSAVHSSTESDAFLPRTSYILWIVALYTCIAAIAWIFTAILIYRPLTAPSYSSSYLESGGNSESLYDEGYIASLYNTNERYFRAARVLQSIASGLAIPITSATCSRAAVAFVQRNSRRLRLTMRQTTTLADKGWTSLEIWFRLMKPKGWKRYGSPFLLLAILLNALGFLVNPLQEILLTQKSIKTPVQPFQIEPPQADPYNLFRFQNPSLAPVNMGSLNDIELQLLRDVLETASIADPQPRLWSRTSPQCSGEDTISATDPWHTNEECSGLFTLSNITQLSDPFLAQLNTNTSTGIIKQWLPRLNSSASHELTDIFPTDCADLTGAFHARYSINGNSSWDGWDVEACMPANQLLPIWNVTRERQDILEKLYMRFNISGQTVSFLAIVNTTSGYFELPNYMNDQSPGQLLDVDPESLCSSSLSCQFSTVPVEPEKRALTRSAVNDSSVDTQVGTAATDEELRQIVNKGPLLAMAVALFGSGSYIDSLQTNWNSLVVANRTTSYTDDENCIGLVPVGFLVGWPLDVTQNSKALNHCIYNGSDPMQQLETWAFWLGYFEKPDYFISRANTFTAMAFLANEIWLTYYDESVVVQYDLGADHQFPTMSLAGMVVISVLLAVYLSCLLAMAFYSCKTGLWTAQLDAFAMLRFGSALSDKVPLVLSRNNDKIEALDELPGWIGDGSPHSRVGALTVGAESRLREKRKFTSYEVEVELPPRIRPALDRTANGNGFHVVWYAGDE